MKKSILIISVASIFSVISSPLFAVLPKGFYVNVGAGAAYNVIDKIKAKRVTVIDTGSGCGSIDVTIQPTEKVAKVQKTNASSFGAQSYQVAIGYADDVYPFRAELSYMQGNKSVKYEQAVLFENGANPQVNDLMGKFKTDFVAMLNFYVDMMPQRSSLMPYAVIGLGYVSQKIKWEGTSVLDYDDGSPKTDTQAFSGDKTTGAFSLEAGIGTRFWLANNFLADLSVRHIQLNKVKWDMDVTHTVNSCHIPVEYQMKASNVSLEQIMLSVTVFFGDQEKRPSLIADV